MFEDHCPKKLDFRDTKSTKTCCLLFSALGCASFEVLKYLISYSLWGVGKKGERCREKVILSTIISKCYPATNRPEDLAKVGKGAPAALEGVGVPARHLLGGPCGCRSDRDWGEGEECPPARPSRESCWAQALLGPVTTPVQCLWGGCRWVCSPPVPGGWASEGRSHLSKVLGPREGKGHPRDGQCVGTMGRWRPLHRDK